VTRFKSGKDALDDWLRQRAIKAEGKTARTYVVCQGATTTVVGYFSIAMGAVQRAAAPKKMQKNAPDPIPVAVLARMAVDIRFRGQGLGAGLLRDGLKLCLQASTIIGARAVLVHAIDDDVRPFYEKYGFVSFPAGSKTLFLPLQTIVDAL
jgi:predicted N-acetyltransferase YhbS